MQHGFQSTLPIRGATHHAAVGHGARLISIHAPHTGSDLRYPRIILDFLEISIHAPHTGSDAGQHPGFKLERISIHAPHTGSDRGLRLVRAHLEISIHAPHTGSDPRCGTSSARGSNFNPRSPYGERHSDTPQAQLSDLFQSTLPIRGATSLGTRRRSRVRYFNPRSPYGERLNAELNF